MILEILGASLIIAALLLLVFLWARRARVKDERVTAIVGGATAICVAIISGFVALYGAAEKDRREAYRLQKIEVYSEFTDFVGGLFLGVKKSEGKSDADGGVSEETVKKLTAEFQEAYFELAKKLLLWGSPGVIRAYDDFRNYAVAMESSDEEAETKAYTMLCYTDRVFSAMREDLQLDNSTLQGGELISIFLSEAKEVKTGITNYCP